MIMDMQDTYAAFRNLENPSVPLDPYLDEATDTDKPIVVNAGTSKTFAPWWQGINVISSSVAQLPLITYRRLKPKGKERARDHSTFSMLHRRPNPETGPFTFKEQMTMQCVSRGNAYAYIQKKGGVAIELWPFPVDSIMPVRENGALRYVYTKPDGGLEKLLPDQVFHLRGPGDDGLEGASVVQLAKESLSGGMQAQRYAHKFFKNDARPGVVLEFPESVDANTAKNVLRHWTNRHGGASNTNKPALLDRGGKVHPFSMSNLDAQFLESREFSRSEVASWLNIPPHMVGDLSRSTFSNIEQQSIDFVVYSLMPWLLRWQDECNAKLFQTKEIENDELFVEFLVAALLRGDYNSRMDGHTKALRMGLLSIDELRDMENMNPLPDSLGGSHYITLDMAPVGGVSEMQDDGAPTEPIADEDLSRELFSQIVSGALIRAYKNAGNSATRAATTPGHLQTWIEESLPKACEKLLSQITPACKCAKRSGLEVPCAEGLAEQMLKDYRKLLMRELNGSASTLRSRVDSLTKKISLDRPAEAVKNLWSVDQWNDE